MWEERGHALTWERLPSMSKNSGTMQVENGINHLRKSNVGWWEAPRHFRGHFYTVLNKIFRTGQAC